MKSNASNQNPEGLSAVWRTVHELKNGLEVLRDRASEPSVWSKAWKERTWLIPTALTVLTLLGAGAWYVGGLVLDRHIQSALRPVQTDIKAIDENVQQITGTLGVLQAQVAAAKYTSVPPDELRKHRDELMGVVKALRGVSHDTPGYWPASFQAITLLSMATVPSPTIKKESILDGVSGPPGMMLVEHSNVVLKNLVEGVIFRNSTVRFDASARLADDTFENCVLIFPVLDAPPKPLQEIGNEVLAAQDLSNFTIGKS
jgi:hypothetical protein